MTKPTDESQTGTIDRCGHQVYRLVNFYWLPVIEWACIYKSITIPFGDSVADGSYMSRKLSRSKG